MAGILLFLRALLFALFVIPCGWRLLAQGQMLSALVVMLILGALSCHVTRLEEG